MVRSEFKIPSKEIESPADLERWKKSKAYESLSEFILALNESIKGKAISHELPTSKAVVKICDLLKRLEIWIDETPPLEQPMRYGNKAFRQWLARVIEGSRELMLEVLPEELSAAAVELAPYFADSFGNMTRIDYGSGHEANFAAWLCCLRQLGVLDEGDFPGLVLNVFVQYLKLMRRLQMTYLLEPAGSHGVWGLDDYHFLPFLWGSAQLVDHPLIKPRSIHSADLVHKYADDYLYLGCIRFINQVKRGQFGEHSPMLNDISGVPHWQKVNSGMLKMYHAEVLGKLPVIQHFRFGTILPFQESQRPQDTLPTPTLPHAT